MKITSTGALVVRTTSGTTLVLLINAGTKFKLPASAQNFGVKIAPSISWNEVHFKDGYIVFKKSQNALYFISADNVFSEFRVIKVTADNSAQLSDSFLEAMKTDNDLKKIIEAFANEFDDFGNQVLEQPNIAKVINAMISGLSGPAIIASAAKELGSLLAKNFNKILATLNAQLKFESGETQE